jgi:hypothetical protein
MKVHGFLLPPPTLARDRPHSREHRGVLHSPKSSTRHPLTRLAPTKVYCKSRSFFQFAMVRCRSCQASCSFSESGSPFSTFSMREVGCPRPEHPGSTVDALPEAGLSEINRVMRLNRCLSRLRVDLECPGSVPIGALLTYVKVSSKHPSVASSGSVAQSDGWPVSHVLKAVRNR